ncbi:MAG: uracil-DNA glycosylase family protein [Maricaulaceae bacterium]|nr:uracil-DNA glycosylase family protein [Maricaulaceae bacterium]
MGETLESLLRDIRACRACEGLIPEPRPVVRASAKVSLLITGQAPGVRVHDSGTPFSDPSGDRLREWMGVDMETFYDESRIAIAPMGFCFPGLDAKGGDRPPRRECAPLWRERLISQLPHVKLTLLVGTYAQRWHLGARAQRNLTETVRAWREYGPQFIPLPHPSWRNNAWSRANPWFMSEIIPMLQRRIKNLLT